MPITDTLQNAKRLESKGITLEAAQAGQQDLKDFIRDAMLGLENRLVTKIEEVRVEGKANNDQLRLEIRDNRVEMHSLARDQLLKFIAVLIMSLTLAVAIIKLFPNV